MSPLPGFYEEFLGERVPDADQVSELTLALERLGETRGLSENTLRDIASYTMWVVGATTSAEEGTKEGGDKSPAPEKAEEKAGAVEALATDPQASHLINFFVGGQGVQYDKKAQPSSRYFETLYYDSHWEKVVNPLAADSITAEYGDRRGLAAVGRVEEEGLVSFLLHFHTPNPVKTSRPAVSYFLTVPSDRHDAIAAINENPALLLELYVVGKVLGFSGGYSGEEF